MLVLATLTALILLSISALHVYWALGGRWGSDVAIPNIPGSTRALFRPSPFITLVVAGALLVAAVLVMGNFVWTAGIIKLGTWALAAVFLLRAVGEFRYVGFFKTVKDSAFGHFDTAYFTPLCLALATACGWIAFGA